MTPEDLVGHEGKLVLVVMRVHGVVSPDARLDLPATALLTTVGAHPDTLVVDASDLVDAFIIPDDEAEGLTVHPWAPPEGCVCAPERDGGPRVPPRFPGACPHHGSSPEE